MTKTDDEDADEVLRQRRIADACLRERADAPGRLAVYRSLVRRNLVAVARRLLPRTARALDATTEPFEAWVARFLDEAAPRTPFLRDLPGELVTWGSALSSASALVLDMARYELDVFLVESFPPSGPNTVAVVDVSMQRPLVFAPARVLSTYAHAVHEDGETKEPCPTTLLIHRDADNTVHSTWVRSERSQLLRLLLEGVPLGEALERANGHGMDAVALASWLAELGETGALLGGAG
jgi:hypothetical protein